MVHLVPLIAHNFLHFFKTKEIAHNRKHKEIEERNRNGEENWKYINAVIHIMAKL